MRPFHLPPGQGYFKELRNGFRIPTYGIGTWGMGGWQYPDASRDREDIAAIRAALDLGVRRVDTAKIYDGGHAEELVCEAIKGYD